MKYYVKISTGGNLKLIKISISEILNFTYVDLLNEATSFKSKNQAKFFINTFNYELEEFQKNFYFKSQYIMKIFSENELIIENIIK